MKICMITIREIKDEDFFDWVNEVNISTSGRLDATKLLKEGRCSWTDDFGFTKATTQVSIMGGEN